MNNSRKNKVIIDDAPVVAPRPITTLPKPSKVEEKIPTITPRPRPADTFKTQKQIDNKKNMVPYITAIDSQSTHAESSILLSPINYVDSTKDKNSNYQRFVKVGPDIPKKPQINKTVTVIKNKNIDINNNQPQSHKDNFKQRPEIPKRHVSSPTQSRLTTTPTTTTSENFESDLVVKTTNNKKRPQVPPRKNKVHPDSQKQTSADDFSDNGLPTPHLKKQITYSGSEKDYLNNLRSKSREFQAGSAKVMEDPYVLNDNELNYLDEAQTQKTKTPKKKGFFHFGRSQK
eukprot:Awhi_evm1s6262